jgi:spermidine synthase
MFSKKLPQFHSAHETETPASLDLWYQERHNDEVSFGLHVKKVLHSVQSQYQRVDVFESTGFGRVLTLDGLMMCSERDEFVYHEMIAHVPLLSHKNPKKVLVIGGGDGGTLREVLRHDCVEEAVLCEIDGDVVDAARKFLPGLAVGLNHPRAKVHIADGVEFVKKCEKNTYDVVIVDSADPIGPGVGLFSGDFYTHVKRILTENGIVVAQCESPWEEKFDLAKVYGNLKSAFPNVYSMVGSIPSYPYGFWSWGFASNNAHPFNSIDMERAKAIEKSTKYYNIDLHRAAFCLPNFLRKKLSGVVVNS